MPLKKLLKRVRPGAEPVVAPVRVLMVCMGNICRSPTAEGVLRAKLQAAGLQGLVDVDSAGTQGAHVGEPPDPRAMRHAAQRGYDLSRLRARKVKAQDFLQFDLVLAMDHDNLAVLQEVRPAQGDVRGELRRLVEFVPAHSPWAGADVVPDPYYGGPQGFEHVLNLIEAACDGLLPHLKNLVGSRGIARS